jgi:hypothetical protein
VGESAADEEHALSVGVEVAEAKGRHGPWHTVPMGHVVQFLQQYLREHWPVLRHAQVRDPAFAVLALLEKWGLGPTSAVGDSGPG